MREQLRISLSDRFTPGWLLQQPPTHVDNRGSILKAPIPVRRFLFILSTLFLAAIALFWIRSYRFAENVEIVHSNSSILITTHPGRLCASWPSPVEHTSGRGWTITAPSVLRDDAPRPDELSFESDAARKPAFISGTVTIDSIVTRYAEIPFWMLMPVPAVVSALLFAWGCWRLLRRRGRGLCQECGYDLRATPVICPECGTKVGTRRWRRRVARPLAALAALAILAFSVRGLGRNDWRATHPLPLDADTIGGFTLNQNTGRLDEIPHPLRQLDGQRVSMEGYMIPMDQAENIRQFALVETLVASGPNSYPPLIQKTIVVDCIPGKCVGYFQNRIQVQGTIHVRVDHDDGYLIRVYEILADSVKSAPAAR